MTERILILLTMYFKLGMLKKPQEIGSTLDNSVDIPHKKTLCINTDHVLFQWGG